MLNCYTPELENVRLMSDYSCKKLLFSTQIESHVPPGVKAIRIPELATLIDREVIEPMWVENSYESVEKDIVAVWLFCYETLPTMHIDC
jgi:hypothetical protein